MGVVRRGKTGLALTRRSLTIGREHPKLFVFPLLSALFVVTFFLLAFLLLVAVVTAVWVYDPAYGEFLLGALEADELIVWVPIVAVWFFVVAVLTTFFNAALVHEATRAFRGERPSVRSGFRAAWRVRRKIVVWGVVSSTVSTLLYVLDEFEESNNPAIRDAATLIGTVLEASWWVLTFFVVPVMLFRDTTIRGMFTTSGRTFVDTWGETVTASVGIGLLAALVSIGIVAGTVVGVLFAPVPLDALALVVGGLLLAAVLWARATAVGIIKAGLYQYATTGEMPVEIDDVEWDDVFGAETPVAESPT